MRYEKLNLQGKCKPENKQRAKILEDFCNDWNKQYVKAHEERSKRFKEYLKQKHEREQQTNNT